MNTLKEFVLEISTSCTIFSSWYRAVTFTHELPPVIIVREMGPRVRNFIYSFSYYLLSTYYMPECLMNYGWRFMALYRRQESTDGMGREERGGFRMGNTCIPVVDSS